MSSSNWSCHICNKSYATKYTLANHIENFHPDTMEMDMDEERKCRSSRCNYSTRYKKDLRKHEDRCIHIIVDQELLRQKQEFETRMEMQLALAKAEYESALSAQETRFQQLKSQHEREVLQNASQHEKEIAHYTSQYERELASLREKLTQVTSQLEKQICSLQTANDMLQTQLDKREQSYEQLANRAVDRPTITNQQNTQINAVKITNYLTDYKTYQQQTDASWVMQQARAFFEKYFMDWIHGQKALARFVVDHIIRCSDNGRMILCCTDTSRKRFIFMNAQDEQQEDMLAKLFMEKISKPIKEVSHQIFNEIVARLEDERKKRITNKANAFEVGEIDDRIRMCNDKLFQIYEFDVESKNGDFLNELAGQLRGPKADA